MDMFGLREGSWYLYSESHPEWRVDGRGFCGGFTKPKELNEALEKLKEKYGNPPKDLEWGYMKD